MFEVLSEKIGAVFKKLSGKRDTHQHGCRCATSTKPVSGMPTKFVRIRENVDALEPSRNHIP